MADVERWAGGLATACGLSSDERGILAAAGALHDLGKADPRFQTQLREGELRAGAKLLAKSAIPHRDRERSDRARDLSGYPARLRHELTSLAMLDTASFASAEDELVRYLVATHHGYCRPFSPAQVDPAPVRVPYAGLFGELTATSGHTLGGVGSPLPSLFTRLIDRYGHLRLAHYEALLRLADHGASRNIGRRTPATLRLRLQPTTTPASDRAKALPLPGLPVTSAHSFLAALGTVEALHRAGLEAALSWSIGPFPHAQLHGVSSMDEAVGAILSDRTRRMKDFVLGYPARDPFETLGRTRTETYAWWAHVAEQPHDHPDLDLFCGLLIDGGRTAEGKAKPTHFDFTAGQAKFLKIARTIGEALDADMLIEALAGPWRYTSELSTLRFEATGERLAALRGVPPDKDPICGVPGADWLAFLGLSYYPLALRPSRDRYRVVTAACDADWNRSAFRWPAWNPPIDRALIAALVTDPSLVGQDQTRRHTSPPELQARGVTQIWQSGIVRSAQGYGSFAPPKLIASAIGPA
ncbi:MAG: type I-G CRISPR-associated protein, Cas3-extension family [Jatrophihabitantaceae bacterium]